MDTHRLELTSKIFTIFFIITIPLVQSTWQSWLLFASLSRRSPPSLGTHCHYYITGKNHTFQGQKFNHIVSFKLKFKLLPPVSAGPPAWHSVSASAHVPKAAQVVTKRCSGMKPKFWIWERGSFQSGGVLYSYIFRASQDGDRGEQLTFKDRKKNINKRWGRRVAACLHRSTLTPPRFSQHKTGVCIMRR